MASGDSIHVYNQEAANMEKQLDYVVNTVDRLEKVMIDPTEFGELRNEVRNLRRDMDKLTESLGELAKTLQGINDTLSQARGGWQALAWVGGIGATVGGFSGWLLQHVKILP